MGKQLHTCVVRLPKAVYDQVKKVSDNSGLSIQAFLAEAARNHVLTLKDNLNRIQSNNNQEA